MKTILIIATTLLSLTTFAQGMQQQITIEQWDEESKTNIRLLPKYGHVPKTEAQKKADLDFIEASLKRDSTRRKASDQLIDVGFRYLYRDIKTAMYRFNQAYLLDSTNTDIYWGFGGVYLTLGNYEKAAEQYREGLAINSNNTHLLTDYGTYFAGQYYALQAINDKDALANLDSAVAYMSKSYQLDPNDQNTSFKLSVCYWNKNDCENAWKYYNICSGLGGRPITEDYTNALKEKCKRKK